MIGLTWRCEASSVKVMVLGLLYVLQPRLVTLEFTPDLHVRLASLNFLLIDRLSRPFDGAEPSGYGEVLQRGYFCGWILISHFQVLETYLGRRRYFKQYADDNKTVLTVVCGTQVIDISFVDYNIIFFT